MRGKETYLEEQWHRKVVKYQKEMTATIVGKCCSGSISIFSIIMISGIWEHVV